MSRHRWSLWLGPPVALVAIALVVGQFQPGAEAGGRVTARPAGACAKATPSFQGLRTVRGAWWRLTDRMDANGELVGRSLFAGQGGSTNLTLELGTESMASGPTGGLVVVTTDDGRFSDVRVVSALEGCSWLIHRSADVVRSALLDSAGGGILAHLVTRETRDDKGTWRISGMDPDAALELVLGPFPADARLGQIWATELRLDPTGKQLAVQSCAAANCVTRIVALDRGGVVTEVRGPDQGTIIGFARGRVITWAHCQGMPCALQAWRSDANPGPEALIDLAAGAAITGDGRYLVVVLDDTGRAARIDLAGSKLERIQSVAGGDLPLGAGIGAYAGLEIDGDEVALAAFGADAHAFNPSEAAAAP